MAHSECLGRGMPATRQVLRDRGSGDRELLEHPGIAVVYRDISDQRSTHVITALNNAHAGIAPYRDVFGEMRTTLDKASPHIK